MKKLISMTDFVLEQQKEHLSLRDFNIKNYAKFLKQPLELWMFVPCDEDGNILEEPKAPHTFASENSDLYIKQWNEEKHLYQQAKETCIFNNNSLSLIEIKELIIKVKTIEFLINYHYEKTGSYLETNREIF